MNFIARLHSSVWSSQIDSSIRLERLDQALYRRIGDAVQIANGNHQKSSLILVSDGSMDEFIFKPLFIKDSLYRLYRSMFTHTTNSDAQRFGLLSIFGDDNRHVT